MPVKGYAYNGLLKDASVSYPRHRTTIRTKRSCRPARHDTDPHLAALGGSNQRARHAPIVMARWKNRSVIKTASLHQNQNNDQCLL